MMGVGKGIVAFPSKLVVPIGDFLQDKLAQLEKRKKQIEKEDPFEDSSRLMDNASPDADAEEQFGHARSAAIKEELDRKIIQTRKALTRIKIGKYGICEDCGEMIDTDRLIIYPEATLCAKCQKKREK
ncbi:MAG: Transcriptional regulator, TraR/DksA family [Candidatus Woesebacteria bacterium GW2011_GWA1_37_8]|uniref:Transcriptional regulator, TraR/DksA family n=1 Tax=Candidatus Woesebacteria bacterium GW2011_GWA1_37_8 TaxID=1618546 RepID=A0A0G0HSR1_9BACT|nr:MAG: Transcriptional regulator, TraR/DksA family [Candidatus Woesebacteria bacterium GW2011_GWA1_37_8]